MTDDLQELERRLELATARRCPRESSLEPETAGLRAGWLALGELLKANQPETDSPLPQLPSPPVGRRRLWLPLAIAALAASLLIAVTAAWHALATRPAATLSSQPSEFARSSPELRPSAVEQSRSPQPAPAAFDDAELAWNGSLDQEIEMAGQAILQLRQDQFASATGLGRLQYQLENLRKDIDESPL